MESKEIPKKSTVVACNYSGKSQPGGGDWVYWHELELENGDKGRCGVTEANATLIQEGCTIDYQYIPHTYDQDKNPTSFKIKYLTPSSAAYKLRMASNGDGTQKNTTPPPVVNNQKAEQIQIQLGGPVAPLSPELGANITDFENDTHPDTFPKADNKSGNYGNKKTNPFQNHNGKNSKEGVTSADGRKYSYAKHPEEFVGYCWAYAKDFIVETLKIAANGKKGAQNTGYTTLKEDAENINRLARYFYQNMKQVINNTELTEELQIFHEKPSLPAEPQNPPIEKKSAIPRKVNKPAAAKKSAKATKNQGAK
jgi:hypothetical protein